MPKSKEIWDDGECLPNYDFWKRTAYWTIEEGIALTLDKEPREFNAKTLETAPRDIPVVASFFEWLELGARAVSKAKIAEMPLPSEFLEWRAMTDLSGQVGALHNGVETDSYPMFLLENDKGTPFSFIDYKESYLNLETAYTAKCKRIESLE